jgi:cytochrome c-type biogenesis protein
MLSVSLPLAFLAGLLSFLSPCVLPMAPAYLGYLSGSSLPGSGGAPLKRMQVFSHALFFVGGFTVIVVVLLGLPATLLRSALLQYREWITKLGGAVLVLFGLHTMGIIRIAFLNLERRLALEVGDNPGYARSALIGVTFAASWTPCVGPLLGTVLTLAISDPSRGIGILLIYALGLATPFLLTAALLSQAVGWLARLNRHLRVVQIASGVLMVAIGVLLISSAFSRLNSFFFQLTPDWLLEHL